MTGIKGILLRLNFVLVSDLEVGRGSVSRGQLDVYSSTITEPRTERALSTAIL